ncbi:MAG: lytic transglycosylase domain-containing protein [Elusimicrobiales bacterium]|nr:lytic transglycosylase domain-containing protein [Elusimicrobiales bacterium]
MKILTALLLYSAFSSAQVSAQSLEQLFSASKASDVAVPAPAAVSAEEDPMPSEPMPEETAFLIKGAIPQSDRGEDRLYSDRTKIPYLMAATAQANAQGVDLELILAIIQQESSFNPKAKSSAGACGLMQLLPSTAKWLGLKDPAQVWTPEVNIRYGTKYIKYLWGEFGQGSLADISKEAIDLNTSQMALAAYNAGPGNVRKYNGVPPFKETRKYVVNVTANFKHYTDLPALQQP